MKITWLAAVNFLIMQWFFIRICKFLTKNNVVIGWGVLFPVIPLTGWWSKYMPKKYKSFKVLIK